MTDPMTRRRDPAEFFGLERALWDDRRSGALCADYLVRLEVAESGLAAALASAPEGTAARRDTALRDAVRAAHEVLLAAGEAVKERAAFPAGPRA